MKNVLFTVVFTVFSVTMVQDSFAGKKLQNTKQEATELTKSSKERNLLMEIERYLSHLRREHLLEEQEKQQRVDNRRNNPPPCKKKVIPRRRLGGPILELFSLKYLQEERAPSSRD